MSGKINVITGALSNTGRYISESLLKEGQIVRGLTNHPNRVFNDSRIQSQVNFLKPQISMYPMEMDSIPKLRESLKDADTLYCTYWVRYNSYQGVDRNMVIKRCENLIEAAIQEKVKKIVFTSHTNTSLDSPYPYIRGKAIVEEMIRQSGISYGFAKPCVVYGTTASESILLNNLAYLLRRMPVIFIPEKGDQPVQPIYIKELAQLCIDLANSQENKEVDAVGPRMTYYELIDSVKQAIGSYSMLVKNVPTNICFYGSKPLDFLMNDKLLEDDDLKFLNDGLLGSKEEPYYGKQDIKAWLESQKQELGKTYLNSTNLYYKK